MRFFSLLLVLIAVPALAATVWKWRDADGVMHYSDQPVEGAEKLDIQDASSFSAPAPTRSNREPTATTRPTAVYSAVEISSPSAEASISNTEGHVSVSVRVDPGLQPGHHVELFLDGGRVAGFPEQGMSYELSNVERGQHSLQANVVDGRGSVVKSSASVTFYVKQPSVLHK